MPSLQPLRLLLTAVARWVHREQTPTIDYLLEENRVLRDQLRGRRLRLTDDQRRRLAVKGVALGRRPLARVATIVMPVGARHRDAKPHHIVRTRRLPQGAPPEFALAG